MTDFVEVYDFDAQAPISFERCLVLGFTMRPDGGTRIFLDAPQITGPCGYIDTSEDYRYVKAAVTKDASPLFNPHLATPMEKKIREEKYGTEPWQEKLARMEKYGMDESTKVTEEMYEGIGGKLSLEDIKRAVRAASNFEPDLDYKKMDEMTEKFRKATITHDIPAGIGRKKTVVTVEGWGEIEQLPVCDVLSFIEKETWFDKDSVVVHAYPKEGGTVLAIYEIAEDYERYCLVIFFVTLEDGPALVNGLLATGISGVEWCNHRGAQPVFFEDREDVSAYPWKNAA